MSDTVEKIYCTDNNDALLASVMGKNNNDPNGNGCYAKQQLVDE